MAKRRLFQGHSFLRQSALALLGGGLLAMPALASTSIPLTVNMSEAVTVTGTPRVAVDVGGTTRYATYTSGSGTSALVFTLSPQAGDVDLDGITLTSPLDLNGGTLKDQAGNNATLTFTVPSTSGIKVNYPSLGMDFVADADGRYTLNGTVYNDLSSFLTAAGGSFTRASIGTYFDSAGTLQTAASGVLRFDYDPATYAAKGFLVEESRTNLLTYSALSSTAGTGWSGSNTSLVTVNNPGSLPVGASACLRDEVNTGQAFGYITKSLVLSPSTVYTFSVWVYVPSSVPTGKAMLSSWYNNAGWQTILSQPTVERDQWVRKSLTFTTNATYTTTIVGAGLSSTTPGLQSYACLAQLEQGAFATSYIPTTSATVTRAADVLTVPVGSWFTSSVGTLFATYKSFAPSGVSTRVASLAAAATTDAYQLADGSAGYVLGQKASAGVITNAVGASYVAGTTYNAAGAFDLNGSYLGLNGALYTSSGAANLPNSIIELDVGHQNTQFKLNGWISSLKYYPVRVPNAQLQLLTQ